MSAGTRPLLSDKPEELSSSRLLLPKDVRAGATMEYFLPSTALGFLLYQVLAYIRPPKKDSLRVPIGEVVIRFSRTSAILAQYALLTILTVGFLLILLSFHGYVRTIELHNHLVNIILGFLCGPLLGIWLNSIVRLPPNKGLNKSQIIGGIGLVILVVLGSVSKEGANLISQYAKHISSLSLPGGAGLQFTEITRGDVPPHSPSVPTAGTSNSPGAFRPSQGLQIASHLSPWFIKQDIDYLGMSAPSNKLSKLNTVVAVTIELPLACLSRWSRIATDDTVSIDGHVRAFAGIFRYLHDLKNHREMFIEQFAKDSADLAKDVKLFDRLLSSDSKRRNSPRGNGAPCKELVDKFDSDISQSSIKAYQDEVQTNLQDIADDEYDQRPYLASAHASLLAQLEQYPAAATILGEWLDKRPAAQTETAQSPAQSNAPDWFELRARSVLAIYTQEWIDKNPRNVTTPLRDEHLSNLAALLTGLRGALGKTTLLERTKERSEPGTPVTAPESNCKFEVKAGQSVVNAYFWQYLFGLYVTMELTYDLNAMLHPNYNTNFAEKTTDDLNVLMQMDLSCMPPFPDPTIFHAQILEAYSRNAILYTDARGDTESNEARQDRLHEALRATEKGQELTKFIENEAARKNNKVKTFAERIALDPAIATAEALATDTSRLKALTEQ